MLSVVPEPVTDHSHISQHVFSSAVHYPVGTPHANPAHQSTLYRTSPDLVASITPVKPIKSVPRPSIARIIS
ncbi:hypothetical protein F2Q69_00020516 [Brassica cretica]|uniref:Uncharacterized protein n=1 Tax=Brassica cretica TaxID=69181 RepID=A0A8S9Q3M5_BRACR|nr:hypothetical protein F2Q69_00020516 [Brassica cretica]